MNVNKNRSGSLQNESTDKHLVGAAQPSTLEVGHILFNLKVSQNWFSTRKPPRDSWGRIQRNVDERTTHLLSNLLKHDSGLNLLTSRGTSQRLHSA